jgi:hypothetical protein
MVQNAVSQAGDEPIPASREEERQRLHGPFSINLNHIEIWHMACFDIEAVFRPAQDPATMVSMPYHCVECRLCRKGSRGPTDRLRRPL